jgi:hypothetical protein
LDSSSSGQGPVADNCDHRNEETCSLFQKVCLCCMELVSDESDWSRYLLRLQDDYICEVASLRLSLSFTWHSCYVMQFFLVYRRAYAF